MQLYNAIIGWFGESLAHRIGLLALLFVFWPGGMFITGFIAESRLVPVWEHQAKMFLPGDLALPIITAALLDLHARTREHITWGST